MTKETAMQTLRAGLREGETFTITTQPHPEPSEEASSLPPYIYGREAGPNEKVWTEASVRALKAERDEAKRQLGVACAEQLRLQGALKAAPVVDVEAIKRDARAEALRNFRHEHGQDFSDAKKWREWQEAQRLIEEEMPEGYAVTLVCSPGDWDLRFTDPECEDIRIDDYESTEDFIRTAVTHAKEHARAAATMAQTKEGQEP
jgi:hypothetical protein